MSENKMTLPATTAERKNIPMATGVLDYFPAALAEVAKLSKAGNDKHNPGEPLHWARGKSMDHADCILRHLVDRGTTDTEDGIRHSAKLAWRALALLQEELEAAGLAPLPRGAKVVGEPAPPAQTARYKCVCGSTVVWHGYRDELRTAILTGADTQRPLCDTDRCYELMERVR